MIRLEQKTVDRINSQTTLNFQDSLAFIQNNWKNPSGGNTFCNMELKIPLNYMLINIVDFRTFFNIV